MKILTDTVLSMITGVLSGYFANGTGGIINKKLEKRRIKKQIEVKIKQQLKRLSGNVSVIENNTFFVDYLENSQVVEQIAKSLIDISDEHKGDTIENCINRITKDTIDGLCDCGEKIGILEENEIRSFYRSIASIIMNVYIDLVPPEERYLQKKRENENRDVLDQIFSRICKMDKYKVPLQLDIQKKMNVPLKCKNGVEKKEIVSEIVKYLHQNTWVHIYGKRLCGKTQTLLCVAEVVEKYQWFDGNISSFEQLLNKEWEITTDEVIFLDNIPSVTNTDIAGMLNRIYDKCKNKSAHLITSGYESCNKICMLNGMAGPPVDILLEGFTEKEVVQLLIREGATEKFLNSKDVGLMVKHVRYVPAVVMEGIRRLKQNDWIMDDTLFMDMLTRRTEFLERHQESILLSEIKDEQARQLLYRMSYIGHPIAVSYMSEIAMIDEPVSPLDEKLLLLKERWITKENKQYSCATNLFESAAEMNLTVQQKENLDKIAIRCLLKKPLDKLHFTYYISHLSRLKKYDALIGSCIQVMEQVINENRKDIYLTVEHFWIEQSFPKQMASHLICWFLLEQLYYKTWKYGGKVEWAREYGQKIIKYLKDVESNKKAISICCVMINAVRICMNHPTSGLELLCLIAKEYDWEFLENADREIRSLENYPSNICGTPLLNILIITLITELELFEDVNRLANILMALPSADYLKKIDDTEDMDSLVYNLIERLRESDDIDNTTLQLQIDEWFEYAVQHDLFSLKMGIVYSKLYGLHLQNRYADAVDMYRSFQNEINSMPYKYEVLVDTMARIAHDNGDTALEKELFKKLFSIISLYPDQKLVTMVGNSYIMYLATLESKECEDESIRQLGIQIGEALENADKYGHVFACASQQLEAEYWLRLYLLGMLDSHVESFSTFVCGLLKKEMLAMGNSKEQQNALSGILARCTHWIGYIYGHDIRHEKLKIGSETYAIPTQYMFFHKDDNRILEYWYPHKRAVLLFGICQYAFWCKKNEVADYLFQEMLKENLEGNPHIVAYFSIDSFMLLQLLQGGDFDQLKKIFLQSMKQIEDDTNISAFPLVSRMIYSIATFVKHVYATSEDNAKLLCSKVAQVLLDSANELENYHEYVLEASKIFRLVAEEGADFSLLVQVADHIKSKVETQELCKAVYPIFLINASCDSKQKMNDNILQIMKEYNLSNDFGLKNICVM